MEINLTAIIICFIICATVVIVSWEGGGKK